MHESIQYNTFFLIPSNLIIYKKILNDFMVTDAPDFVFEIALGHKARLKRPKIEHRSIETS
jgi:hypothetical protein